MFPDKLLGPGAIPAGPAATAAPEAIALVGPPSKSKTAERAMHSPKLWR